MMKYLLMALMFLCVSVPVQAEEEAQSGGQEINQAAITVDGVRPFIMPGSKSGIVVLTIHNAQAEDDNLVSVSTPVADRAELHTVSMEDNVVKMRKIEKIAIPAGEKVTLQPRGDHIMFMDIKPDFDRNSPVKITLSFEKAGDITIDAALPKLPFPGRGVRPNPVSEHDGHEGH